MRLSPPAARSSASSQVASRKCVHGFAGSISTSCFETPSLRIIGFVSRSGMVHVVEAEAALDAEPVLVRRPVAALDRDDAVVLDLVGELAADAAIGTDAMDLAIGRVGEHARLVDEAFSP